MKYRYHDKDKAKIYQLKYIELTGAGASPLSLILADVIN